MKYQKLIPSLTVFLICILLLPVPAPAQRENNFNQQVLEFLDLQPGMIIADVGAGRGQFSFMMAEKVGPEGHVYANEINQKQIDRIERSKEERSVTNLTTVLSSEEAPHLPVKVDLIILKYVYHHLAKPDVFMKNMLADLNPGGRLVIIASDINQVSESVRNRANRDACISDPEETRKSIEGDGYVFQDIEYIKNRDNVEYILVFRAPELDWSTIPAFVSLRSRGQMREK